MNTVILKNKYLVKTEKWLSVQKFLWFCFPVCMLFSPTALIYYAYKKFKLIMLHYND